jgi:hypothetical protein
LIRRLALAIGIALRVTAAASAQTAIEVREAGRGAGPQILARALAAPHAIVPPGASEYLVRRDSVFSQTLIVLGRDVVVEGTIHGDLIVVAGDVYMHPGGQIDGRAVTLGGGVYESMSARVGQGIAAFRDFTYDIVPIGNGYALTYRAIQETSRASALDLTGLYGLLLPSYDRSNGLSIPVGVALTVPATHVRLEPRLTYRSQLGRLDPWMTITDSLRRGLALIGRGGRSTFSNDAWINSDPVNSLLTLAVGHDTRNYSRAIREELALAWQTDSSLSTLTNYIGIRTEYARSVRPDSGALGGPWSFVGRRDHDDMLRPNPAIDNGRITSIIGGTSVTWDVEGIVARIGVDFELGRGTIASGSADITDQQRNFAQATVDGAIAFPTFGSQWLEFAGHGVLSSLGAVPRQRWVYLGGSGTLSPLELLELGGDQLIFVDGRYNVPLNRLTLPFLGVAPTVMLHEALGGVAVGKVPAIHQAIGVRLGLSVVYAEFMVDPATRRHRIGFGISQPR